MESNLKEMRTQSVIESSREKRAKILFTDSSKRFRNIKHKGGSRKQSFLSNREAREKKNEANILMEILALFFLIISSTAITFNFVNMLFLLFAFALCIVIMPTTYEAAQRSFIFCVLGFCFFLTLFGIQVYLTIAMLYQPYFINLVPGDFLLLVIQGLGIQVSANQPLNVLSLVGCFVSGLISLVSIIALMVFYQKVKGQFSKNIPISRHSTWLNSSKTWCYIWVFISALSGALNISAIGVLFAIFSLICIIQWANYIQVEGSFFFSFVSYSSIVLTIILIILTCLLQITLTAKFFSDFNVLLEIIGVQMFSTNKIKAYFHYGTLILVVVFGFFYHKFNENKELDQRKNYSLLSNSEPLLENLAFNRQSSCDLLLNKSFSTSSKSSELSCFSKLADFLFNSYVLIYLCQILIFIWVIRYNCFWTMPLLIWLCYSTLIGRDVLYFIWITKKFCFPYLILNFIVFYIANIPSISLPGDIEFWKNCGFLVFSSEKGNDSFFDIFLIMTTLLAFCACIHAEKMYANFRNFPHYHKKLEEYSSCARICIILLKNLDVGLIILLYLIGLSGINILHAGLIGYFLFLLIYPASARRCFIFLLIYMEIFLNFQMLYGLVYFFIPDSHKSTLNACCIIAGFYAEVLTYSTIRRVNIQNYFLFLICCVYLQYKLYNCWLFSQDDVTGYFNLLGKKEKRGSRTKRYRVSNFTI